VPGRTIHTADGRSNAETDTPPDTGTGAAVGTVPRNTATRVRVAATDHELEVAMKRIALASLVVLALVSTTAPLSAHCQVPCGIFEDELRIQLIEEHIGTIEKSMKQIVALSNEDDEDYNQIVRWVVNKDEHADKIQDIATYYFMAQRIKPPTDLGDEDAVKQYMHKLALLHAIQIHAMKTKHGTDLEHIETLRTLTKEFHAAYFGEEKGHSH
jgi:nickel superoxide dismutase